VLRLIEGDLELIRDIVTSLEVALSEEGVLVSPKHKGELVALLFKYFKDSSRGVTREDIVPFLQVVK